MKVFISRCDDCGKSDKLIVSAHTTITDRGYDWEDSHSWFSCLACYLKGKKFAIRHRVRKRRKIVRDFIGMIKDYGIRRYFYER